MNYLLNLSPMFAGVSDSDSEKMYNCLGAKKKTFSAGDVIFSFGDAVSVKRVIATGGQTLWLDYENDRIVVDGNELSEDYISGSTFSGVRENYLVPYNIPDGKVFVLGDNRAESIDSRYEEVGLIDEKDIIAKVDHIDRQ